MGLFVRRLLAVTAMVISAALLAPATAVMAAPAAQSPRDKVAPPNERAPRVPDPPDLGDVPWESEAGKDMRGYRLSTYTGKYFDKSREQFRLCVVQRESGGQYDLNVYYQGAYQFGPFWADDILTRIEPELVATYGETVRSQLRRLAGMQISSWPRFFQDMGFWTIFNKGAGAGNWAGGNWSCDPARNAERGWPSPDHWNYTPLERQATGRVAPTSSFGSPEYSQRLAREHIRTRYGWNYSEFAALKNMWWRESNWQYEVVNNHPNGPWYGLGQVNGGFIADQGYSIKKYMSSPYVQIKVGAAYIKQRYGSPAKAWSFWQGNGWY